MLETNIKPSIIDIIELEASKNGGDYITAAIELAESLEWPPEWLAEYIKGPLKEKIEAQGKRQGLLKSNEKHNFLFDNE